MANLDHAIIRARLLEHMPPDADRAITEQFIKLMTWFMTHDLACFNAECPEIIEMTPKGQILWVLLGMDLPAGEMR